MSELDNILNDLDSGYDDAIAAMEAGNAEAADYILQGLGMSMDEREKWFDVAVDALQPVIQYGKQYEPDARRFMNYASELVFNPDAIYGTEMWAALKGQMRARVTLLPCDAEICAEGPMVYEPWEDLSLPASVSGGGGTDFRPVFEWLEAQGIPPALLVYFTDAEGPFPEFEPNFPVIWLVKGNEPVPWGQRIQLN